MAEGRRMSEVSWTKIQRAMKEKGLLKLVKSPNQTELNEPG